VIAYENRLLEESIDISIYRHKESVNQTGQMHADFLHYYLIGFPSGIRFYWYITADYMAPLRAILL